MSKYKVDGTLPIAPAPNAVKFFVDTADHGSFLVQVLNDELSIPRQDTKDDYKKGKHFRSGEAMGMAGMAFDNVVLVDRELNQQLLASDRDMRDRLIDEIVATACNNKEKALRYGTIFARYS